MVITETIMNMLLVPNTEFNVPKFTIYNILQGSKSWNMAYEPLHSHTIIIKQIEEIL